MAERNTKKSKTVKRVDHKGSLLRTGESQRKNLSYEYKWTDNRGKRHSIYAETLKELRELEKTIPEHKLSGRRTMEKYTVNDLYGIWCEVKRGLKDNTFQNYKYMYKTYVEPTFGRKIVKTVKKTDVKAFYNSLVEGQYLRISTVDTIQNILHQVFDIAVDDGFILVNPTDNALKELKRACSKDKRKRKALTLKEQNLFLEFVRTHPNNRRWYPILSFLLTTGLRVGEATGLRWCDVDIERGLVDINHTLVYYDHGNRHCAYEINSTKTEAGTRVIPMLNKAKAALLQEKENQRIAGIECKAKVGGYTDFIFLNRFGDNMNNSMINKAIKRLVRDYNECEFEKAEDPNYKEEIVIMPVFSCHTLRHTFATRMIEGGVPPKAVQGLLGHADITTTMNIYVDVTPDMEQDAIVKMNNYLDSAI